MPSRQIETADSEPLLVAFALELGARRVPGWSSQEEALAASAPAVSLGEAAAVRRAIEKGEDPLGARLCTLRSAAERRPMGATYTPLEIVEAMVALAAKKGRPDRIVDPGAGTSRFLLRAARRFPQAELIAIEVDPLAALLSRGNLAAAGLADRASVLLADYREARLSRTEGRTLYLGNPPYVRHHLIPPEWKRWLAREAERKGYRASQLAGLHAYFFLATALSAAPGDFGAFITAAEWLDVNYGSLVRDLFLDRLGGLGVLLIEPTAAPFPDAATTAAITTFQIGEQPAKVKFHRIRETAELNHPGPGRAISRERLAAAARWSHFTRAVSPAAEGYVELGELFRVHRGQVTGANRIWISGEHSRGLPESVLFPSVTKARELLNAGPVLSDASALRKVIDLPADLSVFAPEERRVVDRFLKAAKAAGGAVGYVAQNRRAWWSVGLKDPAPILATYMARRPPAFVRNLAEARHINIAHGLYPRERFSETFLEKMALFLSKNVGVSAGRTYAGGLTKFEPREMERLYVPAPGRA